MLHLPLLVNFTLVYYSYCRLRKIVLKYFALQAYIYTLLTWKSVDICRALNIHYLYTVMVFKFA